MHRYVNAIVLAVAWSAAVSCCTFKYAPNFTFAVTAEADGVALDPNQSDVTLEWTVLPADLKVAIRNRTKEPILIQWPSAKFVDFASSSRELQPMTEPQSLGAGRESIRVVHPKSVEANEGLPWRRSFWPALPNVTTADRSVAEQFGKTHVGDEAKIILPITVAGTTHQYVFTIHISGYGVDRLCVT